MSVRKAAGRSIQTRVAELSDALERALDPDDAEGIHDLRVATRRLRAAIDSYGVAWPKKGMKALRRDVRDLFRATGPARDTEVQIDHIEAAIGDAPPAVRHGLEELRAGLVGQFEVEAEAVRKAVLTFRDDGVLVRLGWYVWGATGVPPGLPS
jgi:CHAD domain-containing protein